MQVNNSLLHVRLRRLLSATLLMLGINVMYGQGFHRTYAVQTGDSLQVIDAVVTAGGTYFSVAAGIEDNLAASLIVCSFDNKGEVLWAREVFSADSTAFSSASIAYQAAAERLYVSATLNNPVEGRKLLYEFDPTGQVISTKYLNGELMEDVNPFITSVTLGSNGRLYLGTTTGDDGSGEGVLMSIGLDTVFWSNRFAKINDGGEEFITAAFATNAPSDSIIMAAGVTLSDLDPEIANLNGAVFQFDTLGNPIMAREYFFDGNEDVPIQLLGIKSINDTSYVTWGIIVLDGGALPIVQGVLITLDSTLAPIWTKTIPVDLFIFGDIIDVGVGPDGLLSVMYEEVDLFTGQTDFTMFSLDIDGNAVRAATYPTSGTFLYGGGVPGALVRGPMGLTAFTTVVESSTIPTIINLGAELQTPCSDTAFIELMDMEIRSAEIDIRIADGLTLVDSVSTNEVYNFINPVLTLTDTTYCPNDTIMYRLDATLEDAIAYQWSTGDTTPVIIATEAQMYMVTVTMGADVCYTKCDTVTISQLSLPQVTIQEGEYDCVSETVTLFAAYMPGAAVNSSDFVWSTGQRRQQLSVDQNGTYTVTVTDACMESASASVTVNTIVPEPTGIQFVYPDEYCDDDGNLIPFMINVVDQDGNPLPDGTRYIWQDGSRSASININSDSDLDTIISVTVTPCVDQFTIEVQLFPCQCIQWPNVFFPNSRNVDNDANRAFGPEIVCAGFIENYEFHIYNRWGQEVFSTTSQTERWNGQIDGQNAPTEGYVWWARYTIDGEEIIDKGDVTLIR